MMSRLDYVTDKCGPIYVAYRGDDTTKNCSTFVCTSFIFKYVVYDLLYFLLIYLVLTKLNMKTASLLAFRDWAKFTGSLTARSPLCGCWSTRPDRSLPKHGTRHLPPR